MEDRLALITKDLQEVLNLGQLRDLLVNETRDPVIYWGTATTNKIHVGYLKPMLKIADLVEANCKVIILLADIHAYLDSMKSSLEQLEARTKYYKRIITELLIRLNVDVSKITFVEGSSFQLDKKYTMDVYKINSMITYHDARHAGAEVVRQTDNPVMNSLLYPSLQVLDLEYLKADGFLGGIDQRKINVLGLEFLPKLGYKKGVYLMNPIIPSLSNSETKSTTKMSSSEINSKIDLLDSKASIKKKINNSYCLLGDVDNNSPLDFTNNLILPILKRLNRKFIINRPEKYGGVIEYDSFDEIKNDFANQSLHPGDLKMGLIDALDWILSPVREIFNDPELQNLLAIAYGS